jgi:hypothetical protein
VVVSELLKALVAQPVAPAVTDIQHPHMLFARGEHHQGRTHSAQPMIALGPRVNRFVGNGDCRFRGSRQRSSVVRVAILQQAKHLAYSKSASDFSGSGSAHSVTHNVDARFYGKSEGVLIGWALAPAV